MESTMATSRLFRPLKVGNVGIKHRIVMPAMSRMRGTDDHVPTDMMQEYQSQRAAVPGTLIITEANIVPAEHSGYTNAPRIWRQEQIAAWRKITDEVHRKGCFIWLEVMGMGRMADPSEAEREGFTIVGASAIPWTENAVVPKVMTTEDIKRSVLQFSQAARNAIEAGFDGIELLGGNGMIVEQFLQETSNQRDDEYGSGIENRSRFAIEILKVMAGAVGPQRVGLQLSPWSQYVGMGLEDPVPQYSDVIKKASELNIAWLHLIEARINGGDDVISPEKLDFAFELWKGTIILAGGYTGDSARRVVDEEHPNADVAVSFGRPFIANPDLVFMIRECLPLNSYDRNYFCTLKEPKGYLDYPFSDEYLASVSA